ncbi:hypothetical protein TNCV_3659721 [Trichonephila clavipes]|nr:hypothetical protein TNCV_3659721 [Trichonephila clavipes]
MTWTTPELSPPSPNYHSTSTGVRLSFRQILRTSFPYTAGLQWYWARTRDTPATIRCLEYLATMATYWPCYKNDRKTNSHTNLLFSC